MVALATLFSPEGLKENSFIKDLTAVILASICIALLGPIAIPLPFTPVPIGLQGSAILTLAVILGSKRAAFAVMGLLAQAAMGLPVLAGGAGGISYLFGPTGGYLLGYLAAAFVTGFLMERVKRCTRMQAFYAMAVGNAIIFLFGCSWLSTYCGWKSAFYCGVLPFVLGDFLKLVLATRALKTWFWAERRRDVF